MNDLPVGNFTSSLKCLFDKNVRFSTVIDLGCADGSFFVSHFANGLFPGAVPLNVDANPIYEASLKAIKEVLGGWYAIAAVTDRAGEAEMTTAAHPYWNSLRPEGDLYWEQHNHLSESKVRVRAVTLDGLVTELKLSPPFLLKLDIQGAETQAFRGGREVLRETEAVIVEVLLEDFTEINQLLTDAGFALFDVTLPSWLPDRTLGWFYPVYLNRRQNILKHRKFWDQSRNAQIIKLQVDRREAILKENAAMLDRLRASGG